MSKPQRRLRHSGAKSSSPLPVWLLRCSPGRYSLTRGERILFGYITISARDRDELARSSRQLEETCAGSAGIDHHDWQDSFQSAASGTTWPIGRGLATAGRSMSSRLYAKLAGRTEKESIS